MQSTPSRNVFLIGPTAVGKTTIGRILARRLDLEFIDLDREIETRADARIQHIFDTEGEVGFRQRESELLEEFTAMDGILMATGAGAVMAAENRYLLRQRGLVVLLDTSVELQLVRLQHNRSRPLMQTDDPQAMLEAMRRTRDPLYREIADLSVFVGDAGKQKVIAEALARIRAANHGAPS